MKSKGLGDSIAKFTKAIKLDKLVNAVTIGDCGCNDRRDTLNRASPYKNK